MKNTTTILVAILWFLPTILSAQIKQPCTPCEKLKDLQLPDVTILTVESLASDTIKAEGWMPEVVLSVPFCKVTGRISKEINFELFVPLQWNGRFLMAGNGGFAGSFQNSLRFYTNQGYAVGATDTGHKGSDISANWAFNNMERQLNFGRLAVHRTTVVCKSILNRMFCSDPSYSYFIGCSRGGGQAMIEAQAYPTDYNGIVAGAPAFNWPAFGAQFIRGCQNIYPGGKTNSQSVITSENLKLLKDYNFRQCDKLDGIADRILNDPRNCKIDLTKLPRCAGNKAAVNCFTEEQVTAIKSIYDPVTLDEKAIYPGFPVGLEGEPNAWDTWITGTSPHMDGMPSLHYLFGTEMYKYLIFNDSTRDYTKYNFKNFFSETSFASSFLDATNADYSEFKKAGGKMIVYHGWNDPALSAYATIEHYEEAIQKDKNLQSYVRLFLLPGVLHCGGGTGPDYIDWLVLIRDWVEKGKAPERIVASKSENGKVTMTRPVFPYPKLTVYTGQGDVHDARNFKSTN